MKVFEAHSLIEAANNRKKQYETFEDQLQTLKKAFLGVADLGDDFQGKGADNIKDFYKGQAEIVDSWLKLVEAQIAFFKGVSGDIKDKKLSDSYVEVSFLDHELKNADLKATEIVSGLKLEMDKIIASISDIVDLDNWTLDDYIDKMSKAQTTRQNTIDAVRELDESLKTEYMNLQALDSAVLGKYSGLMEATSHGKTASPMYFSLKSFHSSEIYKNTIEVETQAANYIEFKNEQAEARRLQEKQEEEANKPWYLKALDAAGTFVGEVSGYYDYKRAAEGVDPVTGEKLTDGQRVAAGAMAAAGYIPIVGWAGKLAKGGKAVYSSGKAIYAADKALGAYKTTKTFHGLKNAEKGLYGLVTANGFSETITGRDMFGNKISDERREQSLNSALAMLAPFGFRGAGGKLKTTNNTVTNATSQVNKGYEKLKRFREIAGLKPYSVNSGDTVASVTIKNRTHFGVNSTITKESQKATRELRQKWLKEVQWVPPKKSTPKHLGHAQSLTHAESHALIRAYERHGSLPKKVTMYVDRKTCNICRGEMPALLKRLGVEELEVYSGGHAKPIIIKATK
ncbi:T7SS effector LXG polymorphic toxin [Bacillus haynesii]|uniref:T7SS effector LXG polymorphic toxin n=1 Tax=Bacillus haynesii TaxID=1925021 RepID=UPI00229C3886|nr:T7SS effector LXG polymorphic toxin [Bacillus haynesii]MCY7993386.1 T7SS effector LXG polymorphic toxin [Bacillus haynesii]MCY8579261.1 T7SS effector LXG polymorphic toxin [Bacillus haynesii]MCY8641167.1 T7SS effector LXG polymorphic toxin [Bacillus haynesii]